MLTGGRIILGYTNLVTKCKVNNFIKNQVRVLAVSIHNLVASKPPLSLKENVSPVNRYVARTHTCGELTLTNIGEQVKLSGWMEFKRMGKFIILRDSYGSTQLLIPEDRKDLMETMRDIPYESVLSITGKVASRPEGLENKKMKTGDIEVHIESLVILNVASRNLPIFIRDYNKATEVQQMKYRYLSLRYSELQRNLRMRSQFIMKMREFLINECNFVDIETPTLFKYTPGGAQEFIVPTRQPGKFYSLVQSPQQFKQLLMVGSFDRYFQVARCYRDETARHDRQPEFTQLDIEMSFVDQNGVINLVENLLVYSWPEELGSIEIPFKHITYKDAMELYGTEQPDLRIPYQIRNLTHLVDSTILQETMRLQDVEQKVFALVFSNKSKWLTKSVRDKLSKIRDDYFTTTKLVALKIENNSGRAQLEKIFSKNITENIVQFCKLQEEDVILLAVGHYDDAEKLESTHHPFTQPHLDDIGYLANDPLKVRGLHYDLVMNGSEIAGGSIRIHDANLQRQILNLLNIDETNLSHMLEALTYGAPPHGGIALGLDRLVCMLCNAKNIKSVIAFPKSIEGQDLMAGAPDVISDDLKTLYHIQTVEKCDVAK
ncbi:aspartate--tRNA ligase, mitochondrial isoform X2 [Harpegnathos saltator]|uniref:aspartate--tRNA ligase, mitochondrial isoform X2 n=1 Tax=Harpegnathos saltator TaxID=610380 RepID=UPI000DBEEAB6|nr:aspartate--tRNA ligase, mitochondrial isoform X2 [Harpegnathos saltator]